MLYQRILITGANGLLGQQLVRCMGNRPEYDVLATGRDNLPRFSGGSCGYMQLDISDVDAVQQMFVDFAPDVVINCAAMTQVDDCEDNREVCWNVNALAVETLAKFCLLRGARLIQVSTDFVFDGVGGPYRETARPNPISYYGRSKLAGENHARQTGLNKWAIVRTVLVYGSAENLGRSNFVLWVRDNLMAGKKISVVTDQWRTPTYAPDLANGIESIVRYGKSGVFHISGRDYLTVYDFAVRIARVLKLDESLIHPTDGSKFQQKAKRPAKSGFIILKAETELGFSPTSIEHSVLDMIDALDRSNS